MEIEGILKHKFETKVKSDKFQSQDFVIEFGNEYKETIMFQLSQKNCGKIDHFATGQTIKVTFNLKGREWVNPQSETKYFNTLDAYKIESN
jgi:Domain of unknown function (DUF3127)